jgi:hypothetical protein
MMPRSELFRTVPSRLRTGGVPSVPCSEPLSNTEWRNTSGGAEPLSGIPSTIPLRTAVRSKQTGRPQ